MAPEADETTRTADESGKERESRTRLPVSPAPAARTNARRRPAHDRVVKVAVPPEEIPAVVCGPPSPFCSFSWSSVCANLIPVSVFRSSINGVVLVTVTLPRHRTPS
ncbi:MAG: hypothetical protein ABI682_14340 [Acidobacteriota bacterium]